MAPLIPNKFALRTFIRRTFYLAFLCESRTKHRFMTDSPIRWVRKRVFNVTQDAFASICGVSRPRVSRYENGAGNPPFEVMANVRQSAREKGLEFSGDWFFEVPLEGEGYPEDPSPEVAP